jgi:SPP1 gp7 family putative phage head morphogenesis protein
MSDFKDFWKTKLNQKELRTIREKIEDKEEEGAKKKTVMASIKRGHSKKLDEPWKVERVYRTETKKLETKHIEEAAQKFNRHHFKVMVEKNSCDKCQKLKGKVFTDGDLMKKVIIPVHPNCLCNLLIFNPRGN